MNQISYLLIGLLGYFLAAFVFFHNPHRKSNVFFSLFAVTISTWTLLFFIIFLLPFPLLIGRLMVFCGIFIPVTFYLFVKYFIDEKADLSFFEIVYFTLWVGLLVLSLPFDFYLQDVKIIDNRTLFVAGPVYWLNGLFLALTILFGITRLIRKYFEADKALKIQLLLLICGVGLALLFGLFFNFILPLLGLSQYNILGNFASVILLFFFSLSILKYRLMDIPLIINRTFAWGLTVLFLGGGYLIGTYFFLIYISRKIDVLFLCWTILYGVLVGEFHQRIRFFIQTTAEKKFLKSRYDYRKILSRMSQKLAGCKTMGDIVKIINTDFINEIEARSVRIYLVNEK